MWTIGSQREEELWVVQAAKKETKRLGTKLVKTEGWGGTDRK